MNDRMHHSSTLHPVPGSLRYVVGIAVILGAFQTVSAEPTTSPGSQADGDRSEGSRSVESEPWMDDVSEEDQRRAQALFREGNSLLKNALPGRAASKYSEALAIWQHPIIYFNLAMAQRLIDKPVEAHRNLTMATKHGEGPIGAQKFLEARQSLAELETILGRIEIVLADPDARVTLNGQPVAAGSGPSVHFVRAGSHYVGATRDGYMPFTRAIELKSGAIERVEIRLQAELRVEERRRWAWWVPYTVVSTSAVFFTGAVYLDRRSSRKFQKFDQTIIDLCSVGCDRNALPSEALALRDRGETLQTISLTSYLLGTTILFISATLLYVNRERTMRVGGESTDTRSVSITPSVSPTHIGVTTRLDF